MPLFRTVLIAADFSDSSREAFRLACSLAGADKTRLIVLHVVEPPIVSGELDFPVPLAGGDRAHHEVLRERLRGAYVPDRPLEVEYILRDGSPAESILHAAEELGCDLVVLGTHGRTGLKRLLMGSVAEAVLRKARCPVLTLRSPAHLAAVPEERDEARPSPESISSPAAPT